MVIWLSRNMSMLNKNNNNLIFIMKKRKKHSYNCNYGDSNKFYWVMMSSSPSKNVMLSLSVTI